MVLILKNQKSTLTAEKAAEILSFLAPVSSSPTAMETLSRRGLNGAFLPVSVLGIAPSTPVLRALGLSYWLANRIAGKMLTPLYNHVGEVVAFRARRCDGKATHLSGGRRAKSIGVGPSSCAVMATTGGLAVLRGEPPSEDHTVAVIGEGEGDLWLWEVLASDCIYFGSVSGSACSEIAEVLANATKLDLILRHHPDAAGDAMAQKWGLLFEGHSQRGKLWRLRDRKNRLDDGDSWRKGTFNITDRFDRCSRFFPPKPKDSRAAYDTRRAQILAASSSFPSSHRKLRLSQRYRACIEASIDNMLSTAHKGNRAVTIHRYSYSVAGLCAGAGEALDISESSSIEQDARSLIDSAATSIMSGRESKEALAQVKSGWKKGLLESIVLEDDWVEPARLNRFIKANKAPKKATKVSTLKRSSKAVEIEEIPADDRKMDLAQVRGALDQTVFDSINSRGIKAIIAPCGAGKSYSTKKNLVAHLKGKRGTHRAIMSLPTKDLGAEIAKGFNAESEEQAADLNVLQAITRTTINCANFDIVQESNGIVTAGGSEFCRTKCPFGWGQWSAESNEGAETPCAWAKANRDVEGSDILINTHALEMKRDALSEDEDAKITIDWKSFDHLAEQGFDAKPLVIRGNSFSIRATAATEGEGSPVPTAVLEPKNSLTAQSKRNLLTWFLECYGIEIPEGVESNEKALRLLLNDHARDLAGVGEETRVFVRWSLIADEHTDGGLAPIACPTVDLCNEGWLSGVHLSVRLQDGASPLPEIEINHRMTRTNNSRQDIVRWIANAWSVEDNREALKEAAVSRVNLYPVDVTIFDESVWQQVAKGAEATHEQIAECIATGEISEAGAKLLKLMRKCLDDERDMFSAEIRKNIPVDSISLDPGRGGRAALAGLKPSNTKEQHLKALENIIPWVVPEGIHRALDQGWKGVMITKRGTLSVSWVKPIETRHCGSTICLDATATPEIIRACFGGLPVEIIKLEMERPEGMHVIWIPLETGTSANCFNGNSRKALRELIAVQKEYGGLGSLIISHKKHVEDGEGVFAFIAEDGSELIYHNGTLARGSNRFEDLSIAVVHDYHAPSGAIRVQAEALAIALGQDSDDPETRRRLEKEIRFQLEVAPVRQATQRIRANLARLDNKKTLVFVSINSPARFGYYPDEVVDQQHLVRKHFGITPVRTREMLLEGILDHTGVGYMPTLAITQSDDFTLGQFISQAVKDAVAKNVKILDTDIPKDIEVDANRSASHRLKVWVNRYFNGSWERMFDHTKISVAMIETSAGGQASPYLYRGDLDRADIAKWMTSRKLAWWRVRGDKEVNVVEENSGIMGLLVQMSRDQLESAGLCATLGFIGAKLGISGRAARTRVGHYQLEGESLRECLTRLWIGAHMRANEDEVERQMKDNDKTLEEAVEISGKVAVATPMPWHQTEIAAALGVDDDGLDWAASFAARDRRDARGGGV